MNDVIITGISRGLGQSLLCQLASLEDIRIIGMGRNFSAIERQRADVLMEWDLAKPDSLPQMEKILSSQAEKVIFINNAGTIDPIGSIGEISKEALESSVQINFISPMLFCNQLVGLCHTYKKQLKIINISTGAANHPIAGWGAYCSTKAAFKMFLDVLALQGKDSGDREIVHVDPGIMDTGMQERIRASSAKDFPRLSEFKTYQTDGKLRHPDDVARKIVLEHILCK